MTWFIRKGDIPSLAVGAKAISSGGGGDPKTIESLLMSIMDLNDLIEVKSVFDLKEELAVGVGLIGSLYDENIPSGQEGVKALQLYESIVQNKVDALFPIEIGGINALTPLVTAAQTSLPLIDGDGMGRAFPELTMTTFNLSKIPLSPMVLQTQDTNQVVDKSIDIQKGAEIAKEFTSENGGHAHLICFGTKGKKIKSSIIPGTLHIILQLGNVIRSKLNKNNKMQKLITIFENSMYGNPVQIISGVISEVNRWFDKGLLIGKFKVEGHSSISKKIIDLEIEFKNEFISIKGGQFIYTVPDIFLVLNEENLFPYSVSEIQTGLSVTVFVVTAPSILRTKEMLKWTGPGNFGLDCEYRSLAKQEGKYETWH